MAECARLLALNLAHYELRYGALPLDEPLAALAAAEPNDDQAELLAPAWRTWWAFSATC